MTNEEYKLFLDALARKHRMLPNRFRWDFLEPRDLHYELEQLSKLRRFALAAQENDNNNALTLAFVETLLKEHFNHVNILEGSGVLDAIQEDENTLFQEIRRAVIPDEDADFLRNAGCLDPEAELTLLIVYCNRHLGKNRRNDERDVVATVRQSPTALKDAAKELKEIASIDSQKDQPKEKKRKIFNGIGNILSGAVLATGNVLLGSGAVAAPNPAVAYGVIGSCAIAVGSICKGMGDFRGE